MTVFVVDDDPLVRAFTARALAARDVRAFADATSALEAIGVDERSVELVLSDIDMPGLMDGVGLALALSAIDPRIPVVLMSGDPDALALARVLPNVRACLAKPFTPAELRAAAAGGLEHVA